MQIFYPQNTKVALKIKNHRQMFPFWEFTITYISTKLH